MVKHLIKSLKLFVITTFMMMSVLGGGIMAQAAGPGGPGGPGGRGNGDNHGPRMEQRHQGPPHRDYHDDYHHSDNDNGLATAAIGIAVIAAAIAIHNSD